MDKSQIIIQEIINVLIRNNSLKCAYSDSEINKNNIDIHLYFIYQDLENHFSELKEIINSQSFILHEEEITLSQSSILHCVGDDGSSFYFHQVNKIYNFPKVKILYNPFNYQICNEDDCINEVYEIITKVINKYIDELNNCYRYLNNDNKLSAFNSLSKINDKIMIFLTNLYLRVPFYDKYFYGSMEDVLKLMDKDSARKYSRIITMMRVDSIIECVKLIIWFMDDYIGNLPITVAQGIDIDYYLFVKGSILKI